MVRCSMRPWAFFASSCQHARGKNRRCERHLDIVEKVFLIAFDRQNVVAAACHYRFGDALLAKHRVARHHLVGQIDAPQQHQRIGNFHAFAARGGVIQHLVQRMRKGRQAMLSVTIVIFAAAQRLSVDRDMTRRLRRRLVPHDGTAEQRGEAIGIHRAHRLGQRRMARHFVAPEPQLHARFQR